LGLIAISKIELFSFFGFIIKLILYGSSCENKKVDTTTENGDGTTQDGDGTTQDGDDTPQDGDGPRQDGDGTTQDDDPYELVYNIKSKRAGRTLRKLEGEKQRIFITINGANNARVEYIDPSFFYGPNKPDEVFLNNNKTINHNDNYQITLDRDGENIIEVVWNDKLTTLYNMFKSVKSIASVDLSKLITSNINDMSYMFSGCSSLVSLNLSNLITSNVTKMNYMFIDCSSLVSLDLSNFNTSNVQNMDLMFRGCSSLVSLDLSNFNTSNVNSKNSMFMVVLHYDILIYSTI